ncbi:MAG: citryl-CoA lyase [Polyangiaceae bacterium]
MQYMQSGIWLEEPEPDNPFAARAAYCHGYDVYGEMIGRARWSDMIHLLFRGEAPSPSASAALDILAVALANPGPREPSVHAAMCGGVGGSVAASSLMAALAVGAGSLGGAREVALTMIAWRACGQDLDAWKARWESPPPEAASVWPSAAHPVGFDPHGVSTSTPVRQTLARLAALDASSRSAWLFDHLPEIERAVGHPLALTGVAAAALADLGFSPEGGEMLFLLLRLPGAAAHALEQAGFGHKRFPWFEIDLEANPESQAR